MHKLIILLCTLALLLIGVFGVRTCTRRAEAERILAGSTPDQIAPLLKDPNGVIVKGLPIAFRSRDKMVRVKAMWAMGETGDARHVKDLVTGLSDVSGLVQDAAQEALLKLGRPVAPALAERIHRLDVALNAERVAEVLMRLDAPEVVEPLVVTLRTGKMDAREYAAVALGRIGDERAVDPLAEALIGDSSAVARAAAKALGEIGERGAVDALCRALRAADATVRSNAAEALGRIGDSTAAGPLIAALDDPDPTVFCLATVAIRRLGAIGACGKLALEIAGKGKRWETCRADIESAFVSLARIDVGHASSLAAGTDPDLRRLTVEALASSGSPQALGALKIAALGRGAYRLRKPAIRALGRYGPPATSVLKELLADTSAYVRRDAVASLGETGDPQALPALVGIVSRASGADGVERSAVQQEALLSIGRLGDKRGVREVRRILRTTNDPAMRYCAVEALGLLRDPSTTGELRKFLAIPDEEAVGRIQGIYEWDIRVPAVRALAALRDTASQGTLLRRLESRNHELRFAVVCALGDLGTASALQGVVDALEDRHSTVRDASYDVLTEVSGLELGRDKGKWSEWLLGR